MWIIWCQRNDLIFNNIVWPKEKTHQVVLDALLDYGCIEWQYILKDLQKARDVANQYVFDEFDSVWCVKGLFVIRSNLIVTWKVWPRMGIIS